MSVMRITYEYFNMLRRLLYCSFNTLQCSIIQLSVFRVFALYNMIPITFQMFVNFEFTETGAIGDCKVVRRRRMALGMLQYDVRIEPVEPEG